MEIVAASIVQLTYQGYTIPQSGPTTGRGNMPQIETDVPKRNGQVLDNVVMLYLNEKVKKTTHKVIFYFCNYYICC